jgi:uncharacterized membrane protein
VCTQCGRTVRSPKQVRVLGWVLVSIGAFLVVFMAGLSVVIGRIIAGSDPEATTRFSGDATQAAIMFGVFGAIALFGLAAATAGASQIRHGRTDARLVGVVLALGVALFVFGQLVLLFF